MSVEQLQNTTRQRCHSLGEGGTLSLDNMHGYGGEVGYRSDGVVLFSTEVVVVCQTGCRLGSNRYQKISFSKHRTYLLFIPFLVQKILNRSHLRSKCIITVRPTS